MCPHTFYLQMPGWEEWPYHIYENHWIMETQRLSGDEEQRAWNIQNQKPVRVSLDI